MKTRERLIDADGNVIPTDDCACGRPKLAERQRCCAGCESGIHASGCNMRCATMGVFGFGVRATAFEGNALGIVLDGEWKA